MILCCFKIHVLPVNILLQIEQELEILLSEESGM